MYQSSRVYPVRLLSFDPFARGPPWEQQDRQAFLQKTCPGCGPTQRSSTPFDQMSHLCNLNHLSGEQTISCAGCFLFRIRSRTQHVFPEINRDGERAKGQECKSAHPSCVAGGEQLPRHGSALNRASDSRLIYIWKLVPAITTRPSFT